MVFEIVFEKIFWNSFFVVSQRFRLKKRYLLTSTKFLKKCYCTWFIRINMFKRLICAGFDSNFLVTVLVRLLVKNKTEP